MDVKIKSDEGNFKYRVCGIVINDNKVLTVKIDKNTFYCLPGGHVHLGEDSLSAVKREIKEEVEIEADEVKLFSIMENFFFDKNNGKPFHEMGYYYIIKPKNLGEKANDYSFVENDCGELKNLEFKWIKLEEIDKIDFRPQALKEGLKNKDFSFKHIICKD